MGLPSLAVLVLTATVALVLAAVSQLSSAAAIGMHSSCNTSCGDVSVPYPFGISPGCHWPGFNLTCDTSRHPPRLLLGGDGTLRVAEISLRNSTVRVIRTGAVMNGTDIAAADDRNVSFEDGSFVGRPYMLSGQNELVLTGCNMLATLFTAPTKDMTCIIGGCASFCSLTDLHIRDYPGAQQPTGKYCNGRGCCQSPLSAPSLPSALQLSWLRPGNHTDELRLAPVYVFVAEEGWFDQRPVANELLIADRHPSKSVFDVPLVLLWAFTPGMDGLPGRPDVSLSSSASDCPADASRLLCKSEHSACEYHNQQGYVCRCQDGYDGNPYLAGGCQDINECKLSREEIGCFGECINKEGSHLCRCKPGTHGNHSLPNGCVPDDVRNPSLTGLIIGIGVGSGAGSILLVLVTIFITRRFKLMRATKLKQKYFRQNRGQLLQQLVLQRADISERMIIPMDELAKATNNFDKARELGGGGHGIVYKGILSDQHVVAIKKSKIAVQKEIDEFINEVAILSQINHKNVVKLFGCCLETEVPLLVYEFISNGTLYNHLHVKGPRSLSWETRLSIATETSGALAYLHSSLSTPIFHRDIKSSNILLDDALASKVSDFGASRYIPVDKTGLTTRVQGTIGYLDPMYFYTGRFTEKSDVYSFGVLLVELLTRKKPFSYLSSDGDGLVSHFVTLLAEGYLEQILDPQVMEEGGKEINEVTVLAASCIKLTGDDRPAMRQVEHILQGIQAASKKHVKDNIVQEELEEDCSLETNCSSTSQVRKRMEESSRRYSMEEDLLMSARYPR